MQERTQPCNCFVHRSPIETRRSYEQRTFVSFLSQVSRKQIFKRHHQYYCYYSSDSCSEQTVTKEFKMFRLPQLLLPLHSGECFFQTCACTCPWQLRLSPPSLGARRREAQGWVCLSCPWHGCGDSLNSHSTTRQALQQ